MGKNGILDLLLHHAIPKNERDEFYSEMEEEVSSRGKALAITILVLEIVLIALQRFKSNGNGRLHEYYTIMYVVLIISMLLYLGIYWRFKKNPKSMRMIKVRRVTLIFFTALVLNWCALMSILDQTVNGQILVYLIAVIVVAVSAYMRPWVLLLMYFTCHLWFVVAVGQSQITSEIAYGNLVNSTVMVILSWVVSLRLYKNRIEDFLHKKAIGIKNNELNEMNRKLADTNERLNLSNSKLQEVNEKLELLSITDPMSGLYNRRKFDEALAQEWDRRKRYNEFITLLFIDIDFFKSYNDNYGHQSGDLCIKRIAESIMNISRRASDFSARYGGEEFVVVVPRIESSRASEIAENIRRNVENLKIPHKYSLVSEYVTVSIGVYTVVPTNDITIEQFVERADRALYQAKQSDRNKVVVYEEKSI